jgi:hypothetical protein
MPSTLGGLAIFIIFLTPGFLNYVQRRRRVPQRALSPLVEVSTFVSISVLTNLLALALFAFVRWITPTHTPNVEQLLSQGATYVDPRVGYVAAWLAAVLVVSCVLAVLIGSGILPFPQLTPVIINTSAWYQVFESGPVDTKVFVGCDMYDGSYISGYLDWYNTDVDEVADRDLVLAAPIEITAEGHTTKSGFKRMILSARNIDGLSVSFIEGDDAEQTTGKQVKDG